MDINIVESDARDKYIATLNKVHLHDGDQNEVQNLIREDGDTIERALVSFIIDEGLADYYARSDKPWKFDWPTWETIDTFTEFDRLAHQHAYAIIHHWLDGEEGIDYILQNPPQRFDEMKDFIERMLQDIVK